MKFKVHYDLGLRELLPEWLKLFSLKYLKEDLFAGVSVAFVAIPLSLAIALASGVPPAVGLLTAIIAGIVCALFGGTPLAVSGPAAAMSVLIAEVVSEFGFEGLLVVGLACGLMQMVSGIVGLGRLIRYMPFPVLAGFTAGIGAIILIGQTPRALGIPTPENSYIWTVAVHIWSQVNHINWYACGLSALTLAIIFIVPHFVKRIPVILIAVIVPTLVVTLFKLPLETINQIPNSLPWPQLPKLGNLDYLDLLSTAFVVYLLASVETLLSSSAVDKIARGKPHNPNQELIGQGLGNVIVSFFGGIPITGVIARSALNVQSGGKTRRSAIIHSVTLLAAIFLFSNYIGMIPIAVLSGVLISVAIRMLNPTEFIILWRTEKTEAMVFAGTFLSIIAFDLVFGIKVGILIALMVGCYRLSLTRAHIRQSPTVGPVVVTLEGPITFLSVDKLAKIRERLLKKDLSRGLVFDLKDVKFIETSGATLILGYLQELIDNQVNFTIKNLVPMVAEVLLPLDHGNLVKKHLIYDDKELQQFFPDRRVYSLMKLVDGAYKFKLEAKRHRRKKIKELAKGQTPHTLFIACSDSRIDTQLLTNTDLGEVFTIRNVGNIIPSYGADMLPAEGAGIEFAIGVLKVNHIIVCGHSKCGAITALMQQDGVLDQFHDLKRWLQAADGLRHTEKPLSIEEAIKFNIRKQIENIRTYPIVQEKLASGAVQIHGWYYNIATGETKEWDEKLEAFLPIGYKLFNELKLQPSNNIVSALNPNIN